MAKKPVRRNNQELTKPQETDLARARPGTVKSLIKRYYRQASDKRNIAKSRKWFWQKAVKLGRVRNAQMFTGGYKMRTKPTVGKLFYFQYNAKHKDTLPYWDMFPLVFPFNIYKHDNGLTYMTALNMHYLPPKLRAILFATLITKRNEKRFRDNTRLKISWSILKAMANHRLMKPCVHSYILSKQNVLSRFVEIPANDWEVVVPLNISRFKKASQKQVWSEAGKTK